MLHIRLIMQAEVGAGAVLEVHDVAEHTGSPGCRGELSERRLTRLIGAQRSDEGRAVECRDLGHAVDQGHAPLAPVRDAEDAAV